MLLLLKPYYELALHLEVVLSVFKLFPIPHDNQLEMHCSNNTFLDLGKEGNLSIVDKSVRISNANINQKIDWCKIVMAMSYFIVR